MNQNFIAEGFIRRFSALMKLGRPKRYGSFTRGEMCVLNYLYTQSTPAQPGELCAILDASSARVAAVLRSLEGKGYVERSADANDRRRILVNITETGCRLVEIRHRELDDYLKQIIVELGEEDAREGLRILDRIIKIAELLENQPTADLYSERGGNDLAG